MHLKMLNLGGRTIGVRPTFIAVDSNEGRTLTETEKLKIQSQMNPKFNPSFFLSTRNKDLLPRLPKWKVSESLQTFPRNNWPIREKLCECPPIMWRGWRTKTTLEDPLQWRSKWMNSPVKFKVIKALGGKNIYKPADDKSLRHLETS